jgi:hypothetical protein
VKRTGLAALLAGLLTGGCLSPTAGDLLVRIDSPDTDDAALVFTMRAAPGAEIHAASPACPGCQLFSDSVSAMELRGVVTGALNVGAMLRVSVSNVGKTDEYVFTIVQVAGRSYDLRPVGNYSVVVTRD